MAEETKQGWVRETEYIATMARQNAEAVHELKESIRQLAVVARDLVYIALTEVVTDHRAALLDHQATLDEIIGEVEGAESGD